MSASSSGWFARGIHVRDVEDDPGALGRVDRLGDRAADVELPVAHVGVVHQAAFRGDTGQGASSSTEANRPGA
jgi:hypothetical protein